MFVIIIIITECLEMYAATEKSNCNITLVLGKGMKPDHDPSKNNKFYNSMQGRTNENNFKSEHRR